MRRARRTLLVSHNITPAHYFWANDPVKAVRCELARVQLAQLAAEVDALAAVSEFNAAELRALSGREVAVIPVLFERPGGRGRGGPGRSRPVARRQSCSSAGSSPTSARTW